MAPEHVYGVERDDVTRARMFGLLTDRIRRYRGPVPLATLTGMLEGVADRSVTITDGRGGLLDQYQYDPVEAQQYLADRVRAPVDDDTDIGVVLEAKENEEAARMVARIDLPAYASTLPDDDVQVFLDVPYGDDGTLEDVLDRYDIPVKG